MKQRNCALSAVALLAVALTGTDARGQSTYTTPYTFTTLAGNGSGDGTNSAARFAHPYGAAVDSAGNVYVADEVNSTIRKVTPVGTNWVVTTIAGLAGIPGSADGTNSAAQFNDPRGVAVDGAGNLYVADSGNNTVRKVTPLGTNWVVTTLAGQTGVLGSADGTNSVARFNYPFGVAVDTNGKVYVADTFNSTIRKVTPFGTNWVVTTLAGLADNPGSQNGTGSAARFYWPTGVAVDSAGNVYVADYWNSTIRKGTPVGTKLNVTTLAGVAGDPGSADGSPGQFDIPASVAVDTNGNVYVADTYNDTIRQVTPAGWVTTLAGVAGSGGTNDGTNSAAQFILPSGVAVDNAGNLYVADTGNHTIRQVMPVAGNWVVTTLAGPGSAARFTEPFGVALDSAGNTYVGDTDSDTILKVTPAGVVTTLAGLAGVLGSADGTNSDARFANPFGVAVDTNGNVYVADNGNGTIRQVTAVGTNWVVTTLAAGFNSPIGVAVDTNGNVYVADSGNDTILQVTPAGVVTTLAGLAGNPGSQNGTGSAARFNSPYGVAVDRAGNLYVADNGNDTIRKVTPVGPNWAVTTLAGLAGSPGSKDGTNSAARFNGPYGVAVDSAGNLYVGDLFPNNTIRKVTPVGPNWAVTTLAGLAGSFGSADGTGNAARFFGPSFIAVDSAGNVYVADSYNGTIRKGVLASSVLAPRLQPPSLSAGQFGFGLTGLPNVVVDIESSGDLSQWQLAGTVILEGGTNYFVSPNPSLGAQFYRGHVR